MIIQAEIGVDGVVKVKDPEWRGKQISISIRDQEEPELAKETDWEAIKEILHKADALDFPRRSHEEIIRDLHELRG
ncbi:MAG: hypothetical protein AB1656_23930 [Candidatus Omnitrophota bacterium]